jgi:Flp pilus assembly protein TadD
MPRVESADKPSAVAVPLIAWSLDYFALGRPLARATKAIVPWLILGLIWTRMTSVVQPPGQSLVVPSIPERLLVAGDALFFYLSKVAWPRSLGIDYGRSPTAVLADGYSILRWIAPLGLGILAWRKRRSMPCVFAAFAVFVVGVSPVLGLVPFQFQFHSTVADRYLFLALLGPSLAFACLLQRARSKPLLLASLCLLGALGARTVGQTRVWKTTQTLFENAVEVNPRSALAHNLLGSALVAEGRIEDGLAHYESAIRLRPGYVDAHYHRGLALLAVGQASEAEASFVRAIDAGASFADVFNNLGVAQSHQGRREAAFDSYREALALRPDNSRAHTNLGNLLVGEGRFDEARSHYARAIEANPGAIEALGNLAASYLLDGDTATAIERYVEAVRINL